MLYICPAKDCDADECIHKTPHEHNYKPNDPCKCKRLDETIVRCIPLPSTDCPDCPECGGRGDIVNMVDRSITECGICHGTGKSEGKVEDTFWITPKGKWMCPQCGGEYATQWHLDAHLKAHCEETIAPAPACPPEREEIENILEYHTLEIVCRRDEEGYCNGYTVDEKPTQSCRNCVHFQNTVVKFQQAVRDAVENNDKKWRARTIGYINGILNANRWYHEDTHDREDTTQEECQYFLNEIVRGEGK